MADGAVHARAAALVAAAARWPDAARVFAYATASRAWVAVRFGTAENGPGRHENLHEVRALCDARGAFLCGILPFEMHRLHPRRDLARTSFFAPDLVVSVSRSGAEVAYATERRAVARGRRIVDEPANGRRAERMTRSAAARFDAAIDPVGFETFRAAVGWVDGREDRRVTVSRSLALPPVDLPATFGALKPSGPSRLVLSLGGPVDVVGDSPELLAEGSLSRFVCYKLSGTMRRLRPGADDGGRAMVADVRLAREHESSIASTQSALSELGSAVRGERGILARRTLRHLITPVVCAPRPSTTLFECLERVQPSGGTPGSEAVDFVAAIEPPRGPYYGVAGIVLPDGRFSFSQVLRTVFSAGGRCSTRVGAAVTALSTSEVEYEETRTKLRDIVFHLARTPID